MHLVKVKNWRSTIIWSQTWHKQTPNVEYKSANNSTITDNLKLSNLFSALWIICKLPGFITFLGIYFGFKLFWAWTIFTFVSIRKKRNTRIGNWTQLFAAWCHGIFSLWTQTWPTLIWIVVGIDLWRTQHSKSRSQWFLKIIWLRIVDFICFDLL